MALTLAVNPRRYPAASAIAPAVEDGSTHRVRYVDSDGVLWGSGFGREFLRSTNDWVTRDNIHLFDETIQFMQHLANGEMLVSTGFGSTGGVRGELFLSSGFASDPEDATWTKVLEASSVENRFNHWGFQAHGQQVIVSEYGGKTNEDIAARRVWLSSDYGATFDVIFDLRDFYPDPDPFDEAHIHCSHIDKWRDRIWVGTGDATPYRGIWHRPLAGGDWVKIDSDRKPTVIVSTPTAVLFGTDSFPNGVIRWTEAAGLHQAYTINPGVEALTHVAQDGVYDEESGVAYLVFTTSGNAPGGDGVMVATADDGRSVHQVFVTPGVAGQQGPGVITLPTANGKMFGRYRDATYPDGATMKFDPIAWNAPVLEVGDSGALRWVAP